MISNIDNEFLQVSVKSTGAELTSIKSVKDGFQYLWQPNPQYWKRQSPVLFPIVGLLEKELEIK